MKTPEINFDCMGINKNPQNSRGVSNKERGIVWSGFILGNGALKSREIADRLAKMISSGKVDIDQISRYPQDVTDLESSLNLKQ